MKNLKYLALIAAVFALGACSYTMDEKFDTDASHRAEKAMEEYAQTLKSAPNGWIVYYFADTQYGGYNMYLKFDGDSVTAMSEISYDKQGEDRMMTSHWRLEQSAGIVLSFDEYNNVIHYFSDPINPDGIGNRGEGFEGDHEWRIISCTSEKIELRGKKHDSKIEMVPLPDNFTPESYFEELRKVIAEMNASNIFTTVGEDTIATTKNATYNMFTFVVPLENGTTQTYQRPFIYRLDGIHLYRPLEINGHTITGFKFEPDVVKYNDFNDNDVTLHLVVKPINEQLVTSEWYVHSYADLGSVAAAIWQPVVEAIYTAEKEECVATSLGSYGTQPNTSIYFWYQSATYQCIAKASFTYEGEDAITINAFSDAGVNTNYPYYIEYGMDKMANVYSGTFDIEYDNLKAPTYVTLKDRQNGNKVITLRQGGKSYPFGSHN